MSAKLIRSVCNDYCYLNFFENNEGVILEFNVETLKIIDKNGVETILRLCLSHKYQSAFPLTSLGWLAVARAICQFVKNADKYTPERVLFWKFQRRRYTI